MVISFARSAIAVLVKAMESVTSVVGPESIGRVTATIANIVMGQGIAQTARGWAISRSRQ